MLTITIESIIGQAHDDWQCRVLTSEKRHSTVADLVARIGSKVTDPFEIVEANAFAEAKNLAGAYSGILVAGETLSGTRCCAWLREPRPRNLVWSTRITTESMKSALMRRLGSTRTGHPTTCSDAITLAGSTSSMMSFESRRSPQNWNEDRRGATTSFYA